MIKRVVLGAVALLWLGAGCSGQSEKPRSIGAGMAEHCECPLDWQIDNLAVCIASHTAFTDTLLYSSSLQNDELVCDAARRFPQPVPARAWSAHRISSPCQGAGTLLIRVRQGNADDPGSDDCIIAEQQLAFDYTTANQPLMLPALDAWSAQDQSCARTYQDEGGYLEFRVESDEVGCGEGGSTVKYVNQCPLACDTDPEGPGCDNCGQSALTNSF